MQLGIFAKTFAGKEPSTVMAAARNAGYRVVQYNRACSGLDSMPEQIPGNSAIVMAHAKDRDADGNFATAGSGVLDYDHYLRCLAHAGFDSPLVTHGPAAGEAVEVARILHQKLSGPPA